MPTPAPKVDAPNSYAAYLRLDELLSAQRPRSSHPDELLFIVQHQTSELWMKLLIHELEVARAEARADRLTAFSTHLARAARVLDTMTHQWNVLETLDPVEYLRFRGELDSSSGMQSCQYRMVEFLLGAKDASKAELCEQRAAREKLKGLLSEPSIYDAALQCLAHRGHPIPVEQLQRDVSLPYRPHPGVAAALGRIYQCAKDFPEEREGCERLAEIEERFLHWRFRHAQVVQRMIGFRPGTGGSTGVSFLKRALEESFFPELWMARTEFAVDG
jgi:tryptophan 2,3-dioxygenase